MSRLASQSADCIISLIGPAQARKLFDTYGGRCVYVPTTAKPTSKLVQVIGVEGLTRLCDRYGGRTIAIPVGKECKKPRIIELWGQGVAAPEIAQQVGCTTRHVYGVLKEIGGANAN